MVNKRRNTKRKANKIYNYYKNAESKYIYIGSRGDVSAELENDELVEKNWSSIYKNKKGEPLRLKKFGLEIINQKKNCII